MKSILICSHAMELGGAERVLLGLLEALDKDRYEVDLFLMRHRGELLKDIPEGVRLLPEISQYACLAVPIREVLQKGRLDMAYGRFIAKRKAKRTRRALGITGENDVELEYSHKFTKKYMPPVSGKTYDLAVSFLTPHYYVAEKVRAKKKIAWIHTDYSVVAVDRESELKMWAAYDKIVSISDQVTDAFVQTFPELKEKVIMLPHFIPVEYIKRLSEAGNAPEMEKRGDEIRLLSIGRFCVQKNFDNVPDICRRLRERGLHVKWYLIGYGAEEIIRQKIKEAGMQEHVVILGKKENPYPYIKACDLYVQPSRYEGRSVCVIEAQILGKPVVITRYPTSGSQLRDGVDGVIVPLDNAGCAEGIAGLIMDESMQERLRTNCCTESFDGASGLCQLYAMME